MTAIANDNDGTVKARLNAAVDAVRECRADRVRALLADHGLATETPLDTARALDLLRRLRAIR
jgi:hypothetical protein